MPSTAPRVGIAFPLGGIRVTVVTDGDAEGRDRLTRQPSGRVKPGADGDDASMVRDDPSVWAGTDGASPTFAGGPPQARRDGADAACLHAWMAAAHTVDRFDLSLALRGVPRLVSPAVRELDLAALERGPCLDTDAGLLASAGHDADDALDLAVDLMLTGDARAAADVLTRAGLWRLPHRTTDDARGRASTVVAAARAALGDDAAFARLPAAAHGGDRLSVYLLARAAEARGDRDVADLAWSHAVEQLRLVTDLTYPRWASARVAARSRGDADAALRLVLDVARTAGELPHDLLRCPDPVIDALRMLAVRDDAAGAALLAVAVARFLPAGAGPSWADDVLQAAGLPAVPSGLRRSGRRWSRRAPTPARHVDAVVARRLPRTPLDDDAPAPRGRRRRAETSAGPLAAGGSLDPVRAEQLTRCLCLRSPLLLDDEAVLYAQSHLRPALLDPAAVAVLRGLGRRASLTACPQTGIPWLGVDLAPGAPAWLARGAVPDGPL